MKAWISHSYFIVSVVSVETGHFTCRLQQQIAAPVNQTDKISSTPVSLFSNQEELH